MSRKQPNPLQLQRLQSLLEALNAAPHGQKGELVNKCAADLGWSVPTVHRHLSATFRSARRKMRSDAGTSKLTLEQLKSIGAVINASARDNGKILLTPRGAVDILKASGKLPPNFDVSESRLRHLLNVRGMSPKQLARPSPAQRQRSLHPNHVWQVDASVCVAYYLSNATGMQVLDERKFYKNKPENVTRIQEERLIRYAVVDHFSATTYARYYLGSEKAAHLSDFLIEAFTEKKGHLLHGLPFVLQMDMGSANTSAPVLNMLDRLGVRCIIHARHNSRANGGVEKAHDIVERRFESALRFERVENLQDLNAKALIFAHRFCTEARLRRGGTNAPRYERWLRITPDQLRKAPSVEILRTLPTNTPEHRRVDNNLEISYSIKGFRSLRFDLRYLPGVKPGMKVAVRLNVLSLPAIDVQHSCPASGELVWMKVEPIQFDQDGFQIKAPVIGEELRAGARSVVDVNRDAMLLAAHGGADVNDAKRRRERGELPFGGTLKPFSVDAAAKLPTYLPRRGVAVDLPLREVQPLRISAVEAAKRLREAMIRVGRGQDYTPTIYPMLQQRFGDTGVPEDQLDLLVTELCGHAYASHPRAAGGQ
jgi:hypothetical protein